MSKPTDTEPSQLHQWVEQSTRAVRGENNFGNDALLLPNVRYGSYPLILQQETLLSSNAKIVYNNIWTYAQDQRGGATSARHTDEGIYWRLSRTGGMGQLRQLAIARINSYDCMEILPS